MLTQSSAVAGVFAVLLGTLCLPACFAGDGTELDDPQWVEDDGAGESQEPLRDDGFTDRCALHCLGNHIDCMNNGGTQAQCDRDEAFCMCKQCDLYRKEPSVCKGIYSGPAPAPIVVSPGMHR